MSANGRVKSGSDEGIVAALAGGATYADAASAAGVSARTVRRRMEDPEFRGEVTAARRQAVEQIRARLTANAQIGVSVLVELADSASSETVKLGAARALVQMALESRRGQLEPAGISERDVAKITSDFYELAMRILPEDRHRRYALEVQAYLDTGRLPK
jgi:hypothetical protein